MFASSIDAVTNDIVEDIKKLDGSSNDKVLHEIAIGRLLSGWTNNFTNNVVDVTEKHIDETYVHFRKDSNVFKDSPGFSRMQNFEIPEAILEQSDFRAIEYLKTLDNIYVSQFITDDDTRRRIKRWISEEYLSDGNPIGKDSKSIEKFVTDFREQVLLESWKIRRIIETTLNKSRNFANVHYINQAGLSKYEIVEILDSKTCPWCRHMNAKKFGTQETVKLIDQAVDTSPNNISSVTPFATSINIDEFKKMNSTELFDAGISTPSYHPFCRGRIVAVI